MARIGRRSESAHGPAVPGALTSSVRREKGRLAAGASLRILGPGASRPPGRSLKTRRSMTAASAVIDRSLMRRSMTAASGKKPPVLTDLQVIE